MLGAISAGAFMTNLDTTALTVALPTMAADLKVDLGSLQWVLSAYLIAATATLPTFARLSDVVGRKPILTSGLLLFVTASWLAALAPSFTALIVARIAQGIGASMFMSTILATAVTNFSASQRGRVLGVMSSIIAAGTLLGPGVGGFLSDSLGWRSLFLINVPIGLIGAIVIVLCLPRDHGVGVSIRTFDAVGSVIFAVSAASLITLLGHASPDQLGLTMVVGGLGVLMLLSTFVWWELRGASPLIELRLFARRIFGLGSLAGFLCYVLTIFPAFLFPIYLQEVLGWSPSATGAIMTVQAFTMLVAAPLAGAWTDRRGSKVPTILALVALVAGMAWAAKLGESPSILTIIVVLMVTGAAFGAFITPNNSAMLGDVPAGKLGPANGAIATLRNAGRAVGVAVAAGLYQVFVNSTEVGRQSTSLILRGIHGAFWGGAAVACFGLVAVILMYRQPRTGRRSVWGLGSTSRSERAS